MRVPSSTPGGMLIDKVRSRVVRPAPPQSSHGVSIVSPEPAQRGQVRSMEKKPWLARTRPAPPHEEHVVDPVPGLAPVPEQVSQAELDGTRISALRRSRLPPA